MKGFRYIINYEHGGIVFAIDKKEAKAKLKRYYSLMNNGYEVTDQSIQIWKYDDDEYYCSEVPDVYDCY